MGRVLSVNEKNISTHSLTRRLTWINSKTDRDDSNFNSQPHKEADVIAIVINHLSMIFQLTASQGG